VSVTKLEQALAALECDLVLTVPQLRRHHRILKKDITQHAQVFTRLVKPTYYSETIVPVRFVSCSEKAQWLSTHQLRHLAGLAEVRYHLGGETCHWQRYAAGREAPDALWQQEDQKVAVEFDAGSYARSRLVHKALAYTRFDRQIWATPSLARMNTLQDLFRDYGIDADVRFVVWSR
jgi:hypothetical protein